jgi:uncharacterized RDD family membrane protein YckC
MAEVAIRHSQEVDQTETAPGALGHRFMPFMAATLLWLLLALAVLLFVVVAARELLAGG